MLARLIARFSPNSSFARGVFMMVGGTATGQGIVVLASPVLTRLYSPYEFGLLAVFTSFLAVLGVIAPFRYQLAIPLSKSDRAAIHVVALTLLAISAVTLLVALALWWFGDLIAQLLNTLVLVDYLWLFPLGVLFTGLLQVFNYWALRKKEFSRMAQAKLTQSAAMTLVQLTSFMLGPLGLLLGKLSQQAAGAGMLAGRSFKSHWSLLATTRWRDIQRSAVRYKRFPAYSIWGGLVNKAGSEAPPILFAAFFSPVFAGYYALAQRVIALPMSVVGRAIADVFYSASVKAKQNARLSDLVFDVHSKLVHIAAPPAMFLFVAGPQIFEFVFGHNWEQAGHVARWLAPMLYAQFVVAPLSRTLMVLEEQAYEAILQTALSSTRVIAIMIGVWADDFLLGVLLYALASAAVYLVYYTTISILCGNHLSSVWLPTIKVLPAALVVTSPALALHMPDMASLGRAALLGLTVLFMVVYYAHVYKLMMSGTRGV